MIQDVLIQAGYYAIAMSIGILLIGIALKGSLYPMLIVRLSFGKKILVKVRSVNRDHFKIGKIEDNFLVYGPKKERYRINVPDSSAFYRVSNMMVIDVDEATGAISTQDYRAVPGFDPQKYNNLYVRTLYRPTVHDNKDKIMMGLMVLVVILTIGVGFLVYKNGYTINYIRDTSNNMLGVLNTIKQGLTTKVV